MRAVKKGGGDEEDSDESFLLPKENAIRRPLLARPFRAQRPHGILCRGRSLSLLRQGKPWLQLCPRSPIAPRGRCSVHDGLPALPLATGRTGAGLAARAGPRWRRARVDRWETDVADELVLLTRRKERMPVVEALMVPDGQGERQLAGRGGGGSRRIWEAVNPYLELVVRQPTEIVRQVMRLEASGNERSTRVLARPDRTRKGGGEACRVRPLWVSDELKSVRTCGKGEESPGRTTYGTSRRARRCGPRR